MISLNKFISSTGFCSRRNADKLIDEGRVSLNDTIANKGNRVGENDIVKIDGLTLKSKPGTVYLAFNKPVGLTSTTDIKDKTNIINFINFGERIFPVGRLDKDSEGLIFLTNDGDIVNKILRTGNQHEKEYVITVDRMVSKDFINKMAMGVPVLGQITKKAIVKPLSHNSFTIILTQGLNRQIRRMCSYFGYRVIKLKRVRIMNVTLKNLSPGQWRFLDEREISDINEMVLNSIKTGEASLHDLSKDE